MLEQPPEGQAVEVVDVVLDRADLRLGEDPLTETDPPEHQDRKHRADRHDPEPSHLHERKQDEFTEQRERRHVDRAEAGDSGRRRRPEERVEPPRMVDTRGRRWPTCSARSPEPGSGWPSTTNGIGSSSSAQHRVQMPRSTKTKSIQRIRAITTTGWSLVTTAEP